MCKCFKWTAKNIHSVIRKKFSFLIDNGFMPSFSKNENLYYQYSYMNNSRKTRITFSYDWHEDYLDIIIKQDNRILLETSYNKVVTDYDLINSDSFSSKLMSIYSIDSNNISLTEQQIELLLDLYFERVSNLLKG